MNSRLRIHPLPALLLSLVLCAGLSTTSSISWATPTIQNGLTKEQFLKELVNNVVMPAYASLDAKCRALAEAAKDLLGTPNAQSLAKARTAWMDAAVVIQKLECFKIGPSADSGSLPLFYFWPTRPASVERAVAGDAELSTAKMEDLGAASKGLFALEYLLFPRPAKTGSPPGTASPIVDDVLDQLNGSKGGRRRLYLSLVAQELADKAQQIAKEWRAPLSPSAIKFMEGGQESINALIKHIAWSVEYATERRLRPILATAGGEKTSDPANDNSAQLIRASLEGVQEVYTGGEGIGLDDYLRSMGSPVADRFEEGFRNVFASLHDLDRHVEYASREKLDKARTVYSTCHALELIIKVDLTSSLGVTLTFSPIDGD